MDPAPTKPAHQPQTDAPEPVESRKSYVPPILTVHGTAADLTRGASTAVLDAVVIGSA